MKILVTGGTGKVGAQVVKELQKRKAQAEHCSAYNQKSGAALPSSYLACPWDIRS
jgi:uncharacterized protein YbjT (DUF2867 family)